ncbi:NADPH:quinone oxidoreductase family protein [Enterovirga sp. CN4-39]|uniref:NADPH:quinone oxidoreductase family protein n=1 Tax=Enterovirga sp. CN4-39 TaxID=3400910 RepID=UPI003BFBA1D6
MRALICTAFGDEPSLELADVPAPKPGPNEVLVRVEAVGVGFFDTVLLAGRYQEKPDLPMIPGREFCGIVEAGGRDIDPALVGRRVAGTAFGGCLAEFALAKRGHFAVLPEGTPSTTGAAFLSSYATALYSLESCGHVRPGEVVLVLGAAGTVGEASIDVAKALGATVVAAASTEEKRAHCLRRGADNVIDYTRPDWRRALTAAVGRPVNIVVDPVGGSLSETAFRSLGPGGRFLVVGFADGEIGRIPLNLPLLKRASIVGVDWGGFMQAEPEANERLLARLVGLLADGLIRPSPTSTRALSEFPDVLAELRRRASIGKPVIVLEGAFSKNNLQ